MHDVCAACGNPVVAVKPQGIITLDLYWRHVSRRQDRKHTAIPQSYVREPDDD